MKPGKKDLNAKNAEMSWDIFISHASEDKAEFVEPLAAALAGFGLDVWYDRFSLSLGDSLSRNIDAGLSRSRYGLVVLSPNFLAKKWPEYELRGLTAREMAGGKIILPIWHNVTAEDILRFSPPLADKLAVNSLGLTLLQISVEIIRQVRPEIFERIVSRRAHLERLEKASIKFIDPRIIRSSPVQHDNLSPDLIRRIRLMRATLIEVYPHSMEHWLDGFKRDSHPSREVEIWEHLAAVYAECCALHPKLDSPQRVKIFDLLLLIDLSHNKEVILKAAAGLPQNIANDVIRTYGSMLPIRDLVDDPLPEDVIDDSRRPLSDKEHFPKDVPDDLIKKIIEAEKVDSSRKNLTKK